MNGEAKPKVTPKDFFLYVGAMAALYVSAGSFLALLFEYINALYPDPLAGYRDPYSSAIRFAMASLVVVFPLYVFLTRMLNRDLRAIPEKRELWIRRWLVYLTLFVGGAVIVGDLIALINTFLGGELTARFVLKVCAVFVVVGGAFGYYFYDLKGKWERDEKTARMVGWVSLGVVLVSVVVGFFIMGSPSTQRLLRFDEQKVSHLSNIQWQVVNYWQQKERLPAALGDMEDPLTGFVAPQDPQTGEPYVYRAVSALTFELCAVFNVESRDTAKESVSSPRPAAPAAVPSPYEFENANWQHGKGEKCFERTIDPERFPPQKLQKQ